MSSKLCSRKHNSPLVKFWRDSTTALLNLSLSPRNWHVIWFGDTDYEKFQIHHGRPINHVVDLEKRLYTCQFWMLTGIPCIHACAALARVNKHPEDFCHKLITMESYKETYKYHINPIPGQTFWEQSQYNRLLAPSIKRKPGNLQTKRRKDFDEGTSSNKKAKPATTMKRQLRQFTYRYCLQKGHTKRGCEKKGAADAAQARNQPEDLPNYLLEEGHHHQLPLQHWTQ
ncbi:hypothetical protein Ahy_A08g038827 [Arachis hypogaea]|uniref:SWIM-type domain-containing protein n=1 Tax=Arachis hypogaea TaxID=3818 RepID=A0A445BUG6_ARAHY|nr:hypothetical protein Ahy_A08g038827 [Arachis hypogaea]